MGGNSEFGQFAKNKIIDGAKNIDSDNNYRLKNDKRDNSLLKPPNQQTELQKNSPFKRK